MFYRDLAEVELIQGENRIWDDPNLLDYVAFLGTMNQFSEGNSVQIPYYQKNPGILVYDPNKMITLSPTPIILVEGFMLHAVEHANAKYIADGESITHQSEQPKEFYKGQEVIPEKVRESIVNRLFDDNGFFGQNKHFVHCDESEALVRRLLRDYMVNDREPEETISMWPGVMETYHRLIKPVQDRWKTIDNTEFTEETAKSIYEVARNLMDQGDIKLKKEYRYNGEKAIQLIMGLAVSYLYECVEDYKRRGEAKLHRFVDNYSTIRAGFKEDPIYDVLPEQLPEWLLIRV